MSGGAPHPTVVLARPKTFVEILQVSDSTLEESEIISHVRQYLNHVGFLKNEQIFYQSSFRDFILRDNVKRISVHVSNDSSNQCFLYSSMANTCNFCVYQLIADESCAEEIDDGDESSVVASQLWSMPNKEFDGLWENLIFDTNIKDEVLNYANAMLAFSHQGVDPSIIACNRLMLFHGPPGTGKTTLCKAIAQRLSIRLKFCFTSAQLMEVNSHSLFSKWFSESGKLVMKMFDKIRDALSDETCLIMILIDEIESLTRARQSSLCNSEPSDAIRVVNAILTQIDNIKRYPNVLILTTSNLTNAVDDAFLNRVDIMRYIGNPSPLATYRILHSCITEMQKRNLIKRGYLAISPPPIETIADPSNDLLRVARHCQGLSGRSLRKLPILALAFLGTPPLDTVELPEFIQALHVAARQTMDGQKSEDSSSTNPVSTDRPDSTNQAPAPAKVSNSLRFPPPPITSSDNSTNNYSDSDFFCVSEDSVGIIDIE